MLNIRTFCIFLTREQFCGSVCNTTSSSNSSLLFFLFSCVSGPVNWHKKSLGLVISAFSTPVSEWLSLFSRPITVTVTTIHSTAPVSLTPSLFLASHVFTSVSLNLWRKIAHITTELRYAKQRWRLKWVLVKCWCRSACVSLLQGRLSHNRPFQKGNQSILCG